MQTSRRPQRLALQIQQEISMMLFRNVKDRRIGMVTVTGVDMSPDLRHARVYVSCMGTDQEKAATLLALNHAAGWIRREVVFLTDASLEYGERIDRLLDEIKEQ
jgi:ribosome-binding factor A